MVCSLPSPGPNDDKPVKCVVKPRGHPDSYFRMHERVRVHSLKAKPQFNDRIATVVAPLRMEGTADHREARLQVTLDGDGHALKLKPKNVECACVVCAATVEQWVMCSKCNDHHSLFCSGECASAGLQLHRCVPTYTQGCGYDMSNYDPENTNFDPMPAGAPVIISGHWLKIMGLAHDLGEGKFVYAVEDTAGNDGMVELGSDGSNMLLASRAMGEFLAGKQSVAKFQQMKDEEGGAAVCEVGNGLTLMDSATLSGISTEGMVWVMAIQSKGVLHA